MKRICIALCLSLLASCTKESATNIEPVYNIENIYLAEKNGKHYMPSTSSVLPLNESKEYTVYPYPNTGAPFTVTSLDESVAVPVLSDDGRTLRFNCLRNGMVMVKISCGGKDYEYLFSVNRYVSYDYLYNPSSDILYLRFDDTKQLSDHWQEVNVHVTLVWQCLFKSGYSTTSYTRKFYPISSAENRSGRAGEPIFLSNLHKDYGEVKAFYDNELLRLKSEYPSGDWDRYSSIILDSYIRIDSKYLHLAYEKKADSIYDYNLGFTFEKHIID